MAMKEQWFPEPSAHPSFMQTAEGGDRKTVLFNLLDRRCWKSPIPTIWECYSNLFTVTIFLLESCSGWLPHCWRFGNATPLLQQTCWTYWFAHTSSIPSSQSSLLISETHADVQIGKPEFHSQRIQGSRRLSLQPCPGWSDWPWPQNCRLRQLSGWMF